MPVHVLLCANHPTIRAGLLSLLSKWPDVQLIGCCSDGRSCLEALERHAVDVFLLDLQGPPRNLHWLPRLHARRPDTRFLALTPPARVPSQDARLESTGYTEQIDGASSPDALLAALKGTPSAAPSSPTSPTTLTPRESEVLRLMACGHSNKAIARALDLSEYTVKNHVKQVLRKLGARNRTQAALWMRTAAP